MLPPAAGPQGQSGLWEVSASARCSCSGALGEPASWFGCRLCLPAAPRLSGRRGAHQEGPPQRTASFLPASCHLPGLRGATQGSPELGQGILLQDGILQSGQRGEEKVWSWPSVPPHPQLAEWRPFPVSRLRQRLRRPGHQPLTSVPCLFFSASGQGKASSGRGGALRTGTSTVAAPASRHPGRVPFCRDTSGVPLRTSVKGGRTPAPELPTLRLYPL